MFLIDAQASMCKPADLPDEVDWHSGRMRSSTAGLAAAGRSLQPASPPTYTDKRFGAGPGGLHVGAGGLQGGGAGAATQDHRVGARRGGGRLLQHGAGPPCGCSCVGEVGRAFYRDCLRCSVLQFDAWLAAAPWLALPAALPAWPLHSRVVACPAQANKSSDLAGRSDDLYIFMGLAEPDADRIKRLERLSSAWGAAAGWAALWHGMAWHASCSKGVDMAL